MTEITRQCKSSQERHTVISDKTYAICPVVGLINSVDNFQVFKAGLVEVTTCSQGRRRSRHQ